LPAVVAAGPIMTLAHMRKGASVNSGRLERTDWVFPFREPVVPVEAVAVAGPLLLWAQPALTAAAAVAGSEMAETAAVP